MFTGKQITLLLVKFNGAYLPSVIEKLYGWKCQLSNVVDGIFEFFLKGFLHENSSGPGIFSGFSRNEHILYVRVDLLLYDSLSVMLIYTDGADLTPDWPRGVCTDDVMSGN